MMKGHPLRALDKSARMRHLGGQTIYSLYPDRMVRTLKNKELFIEKWSHVPCEELKEKIYGQ